MRAEELAEMGRLPLFVDVTEAHVAAMLRGAFLQRFPAHVELVREGEPADFLHVIVDGQVEVFAAYRDRETTVSVLGTGHSFIVAAVLLDRVYLKSARTLSPARILLVPAETVRAYFAIDATFARALAVELALAYRGVVKELKNQKLRSSLERLANWLLIRDAETGGTGRFDLPFDKKILASRLGMAPEVLSRAFASLAPYHVRVEGPQVRIGDPAALAGLAQPKPTIDDPNT
ncbi:cyclic nucleotide-binding domain-containing protein [Rhabdaerophilum calidifontis]|uniref:cyclic nucleotide-binding domain-containing protein n=1 Tax=Rhabdaerophilum calidifontis TaxID=2604328 RepID=UPI00123B720D|nr:cyclic nucleotide-binding domain-containing protein [Rhabdaerophilum calidifontis]